MNFEPHFFAFQEMPDRWLNLKRLAAQVRTMAQPLMQEESNTIRRRLNFFDVRQNLFKTIFKQKEFFKLVQRIRIVFLNIAQQRNLVSTS